MPCHDNAPCERCAHMDTDDGECEYCTHNPGLDCHFITVEDHEREAAAIRKMFSCRHLGQKQIGFYDKFSLWCTWRNTLSEFDWYDCDECSAWQPKPKHDKNQTRLF